uniref:Plant basic secretory protein (BSP) family protein n=1 Tax=Opuntia streptacantha TaxID=393608 RepID=A0A7C8Z7C8_OPUST
MAKPALISLFLFLMITAISQEILAVDYSFVNNAGTTPGGTVFATQIGEDYAQEVLPKATDFIWQTFQETSDADRKSVNQVTLVLEPSLSYPAQTLNNQIQFNAEYLAGYSGSDLKNEFTGIVYHEMTHVWQWNGNGQARGGLIEGIADFIRLKAGLAPSTWGPPGSGTNWDDGYGTTARFLDYCESLMPGFVAQLNRKMRDGYSDAFFQDLLGKPVDQLWSDYKAQYGNTN